MFLNKMNRLAINCDVRVMTHFLRRMVYFPSRETKHVDSDEVNDRAQQKTYLGLSAKEWRFELESYLDELKWDKLYDVPEMPDFGTNSQAADEWVLDEYLKTVEHECESDANSKPIDFGDSLDQEASGRRLFNATERLLSQHGMSVKDLTFAIQGFDNVGSWIARFVHQAGGKVVAVSDMTVALKNEEGIDMTALLKHMDSKGNSLADFRGGDSMDAVELLFSECDILMPGALGRPLKRKHAADVKALLVIDTSDCNTYVMNTHKILLKNGVLTLMYIYARSKDHTLDYLDWLKAQGFTWGKD